jgi:hypothetical protein
MRTYKRTNLGPWRTVVQTRFFKDEGLKSFIVNVMECGHSLSFTDSQIPIARVATKRRCPDCPPELKGK